MLRLLLPVCLVVLMASPVSAEKCGKSSAGFQKWLAGFKQQARAGGMSRRTVSATLNGLTYDRRVIRLDRSQKSFKQSFSKFYRRRTGGGLIPKGRRLIKKHARLFARIEKKYGVPAPLLTAIWGLETAFGHFMGKRPVFRSLATLAYDCRRAAFFRNELISALKIVERGDMTPGRMRGAWAGEIGHTQFLASRFIKHAVSFDGDRRRDLYGSVPDALASTAAWFRANGWQRGGGWAPGSANYAVLKKWNRASVYQKTIARMAQELVGR